MKKVVKILVPIVLIGGIVLAGLALKGNFDTRKGATREPIVIHLSPPNGTAFAGAQVGSTIPVGVKVSTIGNQTVGMINIRVKYSPTIFEVTEKARVVKNSLLDGALNDVTINNTEGYVDVLATAGGTEISGSLKDLFIVNFRVKTLGSATVEVDKDFSDFLIGGAIAQYSLTSDVVATYSIGNSQQVTPTNPCQGAVDGTSCGVNRKCIENTCVLCVQNITCTVGFHGCSADEYGCRLKCCPDATGTPVPPTPTINNSCSINSNCGWCGAVCKKKVVGESCPILVSPPTGYECVCSSSGTCAARLMVPTTEPTVQPTVQPTIQPTIPPIDQPTQQPTLPIGAKTINFEVVMAGVRAYSKCLGDNTVDLILLKGTNKKEYKNVALASTSKTTARGESVFAVNNLNISDFGESSGVAIFIKGMRHLQMKYGMDGQSDVYNKSGGEISIDDKVLDFSKYVMLAGDVNRDGTVDGVDFVEVKRRAARFEAIAEGGYNQYDLDGSCVVNNSDVILLIQALNEKYDQVY